MQERVWGTVMDDNVRAWCRAECERQHATTPADILGMESAWEYAQGVSRWSVPLDVAMIQTMGMLVDRNANPNGRFRTGPAVFMNGGTASAAPAIEPYLNSWVMFVEEGEITSEEAYRWLMYIHPFKDGNGRVGALVYNILNGTIDNPVVPPEYK